MSRCTSLANMGYPMPLLDTNALASVRKTN
jgi:hypothetical protein